MEKLQELVMFYGLKIVAAIVILIVGRWVAKTLRNLMQKLMAKRNLDPTIVNFIANLTYIGLMAFIVIAALGQLGIQTTSFVVVIGAAGLAIGLALQGSLANFAAGFLMILFRPFKVGDFIEGGGTAGVVEEVQVFTTTLRTPDNKTIIVPNAKMTGDNITNYSTKETRRVDHVVGVSYSDDIDKVKEVLADILSKDERILKDPAPMIALKELADSSVNFVVRVWVKSADYWGVYFDTIETVKKRFDAEGISFPFPQRDVHVFENK
jgi:small conductance mechanosensitive channel